jgi:TonB family protein
MTMKGIPVISVLLSLFLNGAVLLVLAQSLSQGSGGYAAPGSRQVEAGRPFKVFSFMPYETPRNARPELSAPLSAYTPDFIVRGTAEIPAEDIEASVRGSPPDISGAADSPGETETSGSITEETLRQRISALIHQRLRYPPAAKRRGIEGTVKLILGISSDGELRGLRLQESSGSSLLDRAALELSREIFPLREIRIPSSTELALSIRYMLKDEEL